MPLVLSGLRMVVGLRRDYKLIFWCCREAIGVSWSNRSEVTLCVKCGFVEKGSRHDCQRSADLPNLAGALISTRTRMLDEYFLPSAVALHRRYIHLEQRTSCG